MSTPLPPIPAGGYLAAIADQVPTSNTPAPPEKGTPERPLYAKVKQDDGSDAGAFYMITVDEGWRESILCTDMYEWAADWLLAGPLADRPPFAPDRL